MKKILLYIVIALHFSSISFAIIEIDITEGNREPLPIAITEFFHDTDSILEDQNIPSSIRKVIADDLERSGLFLSVDENAFIQKNRAMHLNPRFADWRLIKAQGLLTGELSIENERLRVEFRLWDTLAEKEIEGLVLITTIENWRRISHMIADKIYERLTGEQGYFDTRIVYVAEEGPKNKRIKKLAIMDQDGANHKFLTTGKELVLTPRFNPVRQEITYLSYFKNLPRVYLLNIQTGIQEVVGDFPGMTFAPRFSPDGKKIVFNSDRSGRRHLYVSDNNGKNIKRISREAGSYYTPVWSPRGDMIAFTKQEGGQFYIGVMEIDGSNERMIAKSFHVEGPTWAPNGRFLMYFKEERTAEDGSGGESSLYSIDLTGFNERKVITPLGGSDPAWSPLMH